MKPEYRRFLASMNTERIMRSGIKDRRNSEKQGEEIEEKGG